MFVVYLIAPGTCFAFAVDLVAKQNFAFVGILLRLRNFVNSLQICATTAVHLRHSNKIPCRPETRLQGICSKWVVTVDIQRAACTPFEAD